MHDIISKRIEVAMFKKRKRKAIVLHISLILLTLIVNFPFIWMLFTSLKNPGETMTIHPTIFPKEINWGAYLEIFSQPIFLKYFLNSIYISLITTLVSLILAIAAGLGFSRFKFKGSKYIQIGILVT